MKNATRWVLALSMAVAGVIGGAEGAVATTAEEVAAGHTIAGHDEAEEKEKAGETGTGDSRDDDDDAKGGDSSDKADDDASDVNDTDGPGDDEDD